MNIILIMLSIIGLLKLVSLFILIILQLKWYKNKRNCSLNKCSNIYKDYCDWYIIPSIVIGKGNNYFEIMVCFLCFTYYTSYSIKDYDKKRINNELSCL